MSLSLSCDYKQLLAKSLMSLVDFTSNWKLSVVWVTAKWAAGTADAAKGGFQHWALSGVGLSTQGQRMRTAQLHYAKPAACAYSCVPWRTQAALKLWPRSKSFCSMWGYLSSTIKLLQLWRINAASEKQVNIPSTHSTLLLFIGCNYLCSVTASMLDSGDIQYFQGLVFFFYFLYSFYFYFWKGNTLCIALFLCLCFISKPLTYIIQILLSNVPFSS